MGDKSKIQWTEATWNPVTGCSKVSEGCRNCYAESLAFRLQNMGAAGYANGFKVTLQEQQLSKPSQWKRPRIIFVNSMSDLFHDDVPEEYIRRVFAEMVNNPRHTFQVLTKRSRRLRDLAQSLPWPPNIWIGVSIENDAVGQRVADLIAVPAAVRFLSCEPLIGPVVDLLDRFRAHRFVDWIIAGGESGQNARPMMPEWATGARDYCVKNGVPFFFKQWGMWAPVPDCKSTTGRIETFHRPKTTSLGDLCSDDSVEIESVYMRRCRSKEEAGRELDGREWNEYPQPKSGRWPNPT